MGTYTKELKNVRAGENLQVSEESIVAVVTSAALVSPDSELSKLFDVGQYAIETADGNYYGGDDNATVTLVVT